MIKIWYRQHRHSCRPVVALTLMLLLAAGCERGRISSRPPVHLNPNMDTQEKVKPYRESQFFADGSSMRIPPEGTVARGSLNAEKPYFIGRDINGGYLSRNPLVMTPEKLARGAERYGIYCVPCHGPAGDGRGIILKYKYPIPPPTFHQERLRDVADGYLFEVLSEGLRNMPPYKYQIPVADRWAIVGYIRSLQEQTAISGNEGAAGSR